jgi:hypothetical protein
VIQTILSVVVFKVVIGSRAYDAAYAYGMQVAILSSITCVFAVMGVDRTIYTGNRVLEAERRRLAHSRGHRLALGYLLHLSTSVAVGRLAMELGDLRRTKKEEEESHGKVEKIGRSTDAFAMSPVHAGGSSQRMSGAPTMLPDGSQSHPRPNVAHMWNQQRATYASQSDGAGGGDDLLAPLLNGALSERRDSGSAKVDPEPELEA